MREWKIRGSWSTLRERKESIEFVNNQISIYVDGLKLKTKSLHSLIDITVFRLQKSQRLRRFQSDQDEIWQTCSSRSSDRPKCASICEVEFSSWRHTFKMAATTSFQATKCCHLVNENEMSSGAYAAASISSWSIVLSYSFCRAVPQNYHILPRDPL